MRCVGARVSCCNRQGYGRVCERVKSRCNSCARLWTANEQQRTFQPSGACVRFAPVETDCWGRCTPRASAVGGRFRSPPDQVGPRPFALRPLRPRTVSQVKRLGSTRGAGWSRGGGLGFSAHHELRGGRMTQTGSGLTSEGSLPGTCRRPQKCARPSDAWSPTT